MQRKRLMMLVAMLIGCVLLAGCQIPGEGAPPITPVATPSGVPPTSVLGIQGDASTITSFPGIPWVRLGYPTCVTSNLSGQTLKDTISSYHSQGMRVLLTYCQTRGSSLLNTNLLDDAAQSGADAVQCGNEQMKQSDATTYVAPALFARFYDLCQSAMHAVQPNIPIILGAMDPWVVPNDNAQLMNQVHYLDAMQTAMNSTVHPGSNWSWRSQILGLIDSWHNGYPDANTNNLYQLYLFWAQQLHISLQSGNLGKHLWTIEGTGCVGGCGLDASNAREIAISHIITLITDVQTTMNYRVPFFYFSGKDFTTGATGLILGVLDANGRSKPLRQDLSMNARTLKISCASGESVVADQEQLLAKLYSGCKLPADYASTLEN
jgi:hypothetical protein